MSKALQDFDKALNDKDYVKARKLLTKVKVDEGDRVALEGVIAIREDRLKDAEHLLQKSLSIKPNGLLAYSNLVPLYVRLGDHKKAVIYGEVAYKSQPKNINISVNYASALLQEQQFSKVIEVLEPHLDAPKFQSGIHSALISAYRSLFQYEKAEELLDKALKLFPENTELLRVGADLFADRDPLRAIAAFDAAEKADPNSVATQWNRSLSDLRVGDFARGWKNYDAGLLPAIGKIGRPLPKLFEGAPIITDLSKLDKDKWTFAVVEQGIGDQILFLGALNDMRKDCPKLALICEKRMAPIMERSFPDIAVYSYGIGQLVADSPKSVNGIVPIGSIQKKYRNSKKKYLAHRKPYLVPDEKMVAKYREKLLKKIGAKKMVGFSWKGGFWERAQQTKTLEIELWEPLFEKHPDWIFVCLQYGDVSKEKEYLAAKYKNIRFIDGIDFKKDLDLWFALACACDEIVSVSTALVHFAGAAGKKIHLLLSDKGAPFIWGLEGDESICYQNVRIYRKTADETPAVFFTHVANEMEKSG